MEIFDAGCFCGNWPFRRIRNNTLEKMRLLHRQNGVTGGCMAALEAVFYNDPAEADEALQKQLAGSEYRPVLTVNPTLPAWEKDMERAAGKFAGVRLYPGYHGYSLKDESVFRLCELAAELKLPVTISLRMEDERNTYIFQPRKLEIDEIDVLINHQKDCTIILSSLRIGECTELKESIKKLRNVYMDTAGLKDGLFTVERAIALVGADKLLFASMAPINCVNSTLLLVQRDALAEGDKEKILSKNARKIYG